MPLQIETQLALLRAQRALARKKAEQREAFLESLVGEKEEAMKAHGPLLAEDKKTLDALNTIIATMEADIIKAREVPTVEEQPA